MAEVAAVALRGLLCSAAAMVVQATLVALALEDWVARPETMAAMQKPTPGLVVVALATMASTLALEALPGSMSSRLSTAHLRPTLILLAAVAMVAPQATSLAAMARQE